LSPKDSHFADLNILGIDFCAMAKLRVWPDFEKETVEFFFGNKWKVSGPELWYLLDVIQ
jgi:hypothetical protein